MKNTPNSVLFTIPLLSNFVREFSKMFYSNFIEDTMEFKQEELIEREIQIAHFLMLDFSLKHISETTGLSKRILVAHVKNMMKKLKADDKPALIKLLKAKISPKISCSFDAR